MIALWMIYLLVITALLGAVAASAEHVIGALDRPRRWVWAAALVGVAALASFNTWRPAASAATAGPQPSLSEPTPLEENEGASIDLAALLARVTPDPAMLERLESPLTIAWALGAGLVGILYAGGAFALGRQRRRWRVASVDGTDVLVAPSAGPALVGVFRPRVVLPEWALDSAPNERALMLAHEREHAVARDPLLLHAAWLVVLAMPWNVAAWWVLRRLRAAVEMDCDARVLRSRPDPVAYSQLLLEVGLRGPRGVPALAPALLERTSTLSRRIVAMYKHRSRMPKARVAATTMAAVFGLALACAAPSPEMLAPDGRDVLETTVLGTATLPTPTGDSLRALIAHHFPDVAAGRVDSAILVFVRDQRGRILTVEQLGRDGLKVKMADAGMLTSSENAVMRRDPLQSKVTVDERRRIAGYAADEIESVEVLKRASGGLAPTPTSVIWITVKSEGAK